MKKIFIILFMFFAVYLISINSSNDVLENGESLRVRVIPNSDNVNDVFMKMKVVEVLRENLFNKMSNNIESDRVIIKESMDVMHDKIDSMFNKYNYNVKYSINYGDNYFPEKKIDDVIISEGNYESLVVSIGEAKGNNFWCMLYPNYCLLEADTDEEDTDVNYDLYLLKLLKNFLK